MINKKYIDELLDKLVNNQLTEEEYHKLIAIIDKAENQEEIKGILGEYLETEKAPGFASNRNEKDVDKLFNRIMKSIDEDELEVKGKETWVGKISMYQFYKVAAVLIFLVGLFYFFNNDAFISQDTAITTSGCIDKDNVILKLADGEVVVISQNEQKEILGRKGGIVAEQNGSWLTYTGKNKTKKVSYNELSIPYGKKFDLVLADGTHVTLNAGSWIKYPVQFSIDGSRKVFFKGEAYFDVAEDKIRPFVVKTGAVGVEVLGTEFNVSNYPEDSQINTVLVEGSVKIRAKNNKDDKTSSRLLLPGHKAAWSNENGSMTMEKVDVSKYIAWKEGILRFENMQFSDIRRKLERHFGVSIKNNNQVLERQVYTATFKEEGIEEILNAFKEDTPFEFELNDNRVIIKTD
ncbi:FecR domain-containing protein [uncultured Salegentibacter sp.]|uniref:FecR family protein n=1 Tax=uncultured Salegentibacter sp. TaxID=259320 RepID=UPI0025973E65|nr:FecR domain-containing protein [uncultured Salegentibacter sp.]